MQYLKAFMAGIVLPSILLPIGLYTAIAMGKPQLLGIPFLHTIPLIWGIWNMLYFAFFKPLLPMNVNVRLLLTGAILGLLVACCGIFWLHLPRLLEMGKFWYLPLFIGPVLYAILWWLVVRPLNEVLGLKN